MTEIISTTQAPPRRFDDVPWVSAHIQEASSADGSFTTIDTIDFETVDADPSNPADQSLTTDLGTSAGLWYRLIFVDENGNQSDPTVAWQNGVSTGYATVGELSRILKITNPTGDQTRAMQRVLDAATLEINDEIGQRSGLSELEQQLAAEVNLERAVEHWQQQEKAFGVVGIGAELPIRISADTWERHAKKLQPLKQSWGLA